VPHLDDTKNDGIHPNGLKSTSQPFHYSTYSIFYILSPFSPGPMRGQQYITKE